MDDDAFLRALPGFSGLCAGSGVSRIDLLGMAGDIGTTLATLMAGLHPLPIRERGLKEH